MGLLNILFKKSDKSINVSSSDLINQGRQALIMANDLFFDQNSVDMSILDLCDLSLAAGIKEAYRTRALYLFKLEYHYAAITDFDHAILIFPEEAYLYHCRGLCRAYIGNKDAALEDLKSAIKLSKQTGNENKKQDQKASIIGYSSATELYRKLYEYVSLDYYKDKITRKWSNS